MKTLLMSVILCVLSFTAFSATAENLTESLKIIPVQDAGRIKPFDTFCREMMSLMHGRETYRDKGEGDPHPAYEIVMTWLLQPTVWLDRPFIEVKHNDVRKGLKLANDRKYFSPNEIMASDRFQLMMQELQSKRETKEKLNPYFQALQRLENQIFTFRELASGRSLKMIPPQQGDSWISVSEMNEAQTNAFMNVTKAFLTVIGIYTDHSATSEKKLEVKKELDLAVSDFMAEAQKQNPELYSSLKDIKLEVHYNNFHPFQKAWIFYALASVLVLLTWITGKTLFYRIAWGATLLGVICHVYGFGMRSYLMGRPPVSNMYETVVWVGFGALIFSIIIELVYKFRITLLVGTAVAAFCMILADMAPAILDSSLQPLEPVLRSNFWLLIHVLTITISYSAFFLAFGLGDWGLFYYLKGEERNKAKIQMISTAIYRCMQIGVVLLAAGIILGGIWADYSWGRFWGWDPKETWALIALLGYIAVLHGRIAGWLKQFGLIASAIIAFSLVIMAWYGVNYVLGAGLHSYGFGAGGLEYVSGFVALHIIYVAVAITIRQGRQGTTSKAS